MTHDLPWFGNSAYVHLILIFYWLCLLFIRLSFWLKDSISWGVRHSTSEAIVVHLHLLRLRLFHRKTFFVKHFTGFLVFGSTITYGQWKTIKKKKILYVTVNYFTFMFSVKQSKQSLSPHARAPLRPVSYLSLSL